ncbi:hypothetical protein N0V93_004911 [Gnomoniopsis smithogilvyi]|uniref:Sphingoid long-chain base transporter RSB1 n=1 Tax=Gnomoniopsis smithogilvyi TaxID=1191159 RepID=A0A9W9CXK7_9PEZI|nr:hypothetical protein N0V93_004911 [Gnomoniopsis smithogilvyi]
MDRMKALNDYLASTGQPTFDFFGPNANCTLDLCSPRWSVYGYRPSLGANAFYAGIFFCAMLAHVAVGVKRRAWSFMACMVCGCVDEMMGYAARVWMFYDLWNFSAFMIQVVCITTAPVFYCAAIYIVLAKTIETFAPSLSRFRPSLLYYIFIPSDMLSLVLQGAGGALSATSSGVSHTGVCIALAGLALQVTTLMLFCTIYIEYIMRYYRSGVAKRHAFHRRKSRGMTFGTRLSIFFVFEMLAVFVILARCVFRMVELREGYGGLLVRKEDLFIGLEGVLIVGAAFMLCVGHPALIFNSTRQREGSVATSSVEEAQHDK